ncbi:MAG: Rrf2 family transcriptional regulator [Gammaproteobacteria bacterium]|nr:Rrf2 family transcriptional regulator [Gammaproteobacteria bacterium]
MRLTAKSRHAVAALIDLGLKAGKYPVALIDILEDHDISLSYLEQIFSNLKAANLVVGIRGPRGGYRLSAPPEEITVKQIVEAVEETSKRARKSLITGEKSAAHEAWNILSTQITDFLQGITLAQLLANVANASPAKQRSATSNRRTQHSRRRRTA